MTPQEKMKELLDHGAVIAFIDGRVPELTLASVQWLENPTRIRWCAIFPQHQGHVHDTEYNRVAIVNDLYLVFYDAAGEMEMCIGPYEEAARNTDEIREALANWRQTLSLNNNTEQFKRFLEDAV